MSPTCSRTETVGGAILLSAAAGAAVDQFPLSGGLQRPPRCRRRTPRAAPRPAPRGWAADGLLAVFVLVAGIELKREFVAGDLSDRRKAALPIAAAMCGVALPALLFAMTATLMSPDGNASELGGILRGWAIPTATDIAFALAVLAVIVIAALLATVVLRLRNRHYSLVEAGDLRP